MSRLGSLALRLYPAELRQSYGPDALQLFQDRWREHGGLRRARLCLDLPADLVSTRVHACVDRRPVPAANTTPSGLFHAFERDAVGAGTVLPRMVLALLMVPLFVTLITP